MKPDFKEILYETAGPVARIWHNRPEKRNAQSVRLLDEMDEAVQIAMADAAVRVIVIAGKGDHFSAGHDVKEAYLTRGDETMEERFAFEKKHYLQYCLNIWDCPKPTIAQVQGACIAGGFLVANMCDLIVASDDAFFSDPVVNKFGSAATEVLVHPWSLGLRRAKYMLFTGQPLTAQAALDIGLVCEVSPRDQLDATVDVLANRIAEVPSIALELTKRSLNRSLDIQGFKSALNAHFDTHQLSHLSDMMTSHLAASSKAAQSSD